MECRKYGTVSFFLFTGSRERFDAQMEKQVRAAIDRCAADLNCETGDEGRGDGGAQCPCRIFLREAWRGSWTQATLAELAERMKMSEMDP